MGVPASFAPVNRVRFASFRTAGAKGRTQRFVGSRLWISSFALPQDCLRESLPAIAQLLCAER